MQASVIGVNRRGSIRYPVECAAAYKLQSEAESHRAVVLDISADGLLLRSDRVLEVGIPIEVTIPWPAVRGFEKGLNLHAVGSTVRSDGQHTAVRLDRSEFRVKT